MNIGDLVKHKYNGGVGIITGSRFGHSNITMGTTEWVTIKWIEIQLSSLREKIWRQVRKVYLMDFQKV